MPEKVPPDLSRACLLSPMPGLSCALRVREGDTVEPGQPLANGRGDEDGERAARPEAGRTVKAVNRRAWGLTAWRPDAVILELE